MSEDEVDRKIREHNEKKANVIKIDTTNVTKIIEQLKEKDLEAKQLAEQLEAEKTIKEDYESKLKIIAEQRLEEHRQKLRNMGFKGDLETIEQVKSAEKHFGLRKDNDGRGSVGVIPWKSQEELDNLGKEEFEDSLEMLLHVQKNQPEIYEKIKDKAIKGLSEGKQGFVWKDNFHGGNSVIKRILEEQNEREREKHKGE